MEIAKIKYYENNINLKKKMPLHLKEVLSRIDQTLAGKVQCDYCGYWVLDLRKHADKKHLGLYCKRITSDFYSKSYLNNRK